MDSTRDVIVGAVRSATHVAVQYLIFFDIVVKKAIPLTHYVNTEAYIALGIT